MGQATSSDISSADHIIPESVSVIQEGVLRQARIFTEIATLSYEDFQLCLLELNELSRKVTDCKGKTLLFAVKKGTDSSILWKGTVKIACVKVDSDTKIVESLRLFNLNQFMKIFKTLKCQLTAALQSSLQEMETGGLGDSQGEKSDSDDSSYHETENSSQDSSENELNQREMEERQILSTVPVKNFKRPANMKLFQHKNIKKLTASMLLEEVDNLANSINTVDKLGECCICFERKIDVMLPCAHAYCLRCIEEWNTGHKTCPFCRETLNNTDDTWVISDIPGSQEISDEICSALMDLDRV